VEVQVLSSAFGRPRRGRSVIWRRFIVKLYAELAPWFHLLTHPDDYAEEADFTERLIDAAIDGEAKTLLELGSGGGNNASS
jgi:hypothetical protein